MGRRLLNNGAAGEWRRAGGDATLESTGTVVNERKGRRPTFLCGDGVRSELTMDEVNVGAQISKPSGLMHTGSTQSREERVTW